MKSFIALFAFAALAIGSDRAFAQAHVVENQTTYVYVDANLGSDSNPGTKAAPLKTITAGTNKALANNENNVGTMVFINPGTYREWVNVHQTSRQTGATITLQATVPGTAVIAASDALSGWSQIGSAEYVHHWQDTVSGCYPPSGWPNLPAITSRAEMVYLNHSPLTQILDPADQHPGTFYADVANQQLHVWPFSGTNMNTALVEVAARRSTLVINSRSNVVLRGLVLQHAASCMNNNAADIWTSNNILLDKVQVLWNNWTGLGISGRSSNITMQDSVLSHNGGLGLGSYTSTNVLYQRNETSYNNWRGAMGAFYDYAMGGVKLMQMHGVQMLQHLSYRNQAEGVWFDTDNKNVTINGSALSENLIANLKLESDQGPVAVQSSSFCSSSSGILVLNTTGISVTGSNFYNNGGTAKWQGNFFLGGSTSGRSFSDWQTGQSYNLQTTNTTFQGNIFTDASAGQNVFASYFTGSVWSTFVNSLHSNQNTWFDPSVSSAFVTPTGHYSLSGWQNVTGQDANSYWGAAAAATKNCGVPAPSFADFSIGANNRENASMSTAAAPYYMSSGTVNIPLQVKSFGVGGVNLSISGLPSGVTGYFTTPSLTTGNTVLVLKAASNAAYQTVPVNIFGVSGGRVHSVTVFVGVRT